jgi:flagellar assembly protein FliH
MSIVVSDRACIVGLRQLLDRPTRAATDAVEGGGTPPAEVPDPAAELEALRRQVQAEAAQAGYSEGMARAEKAVADAVAHARRQVEQADAAVREELQATVTQLKATLHTLSAAVEKVNETSLPVAITIAVAAVARLVGQAHADRTLMAAICRQALDEYRQRPVVIRLCSEEADQVGPAIADIADVRVEVDSLLKPGECRLETHRGLYDTSLSVRLEAITRAIVNEIGDVR